MQVGYEVISYVLYDTIKIPKGHERNFKMFSEPMGTGTPQKTRADTNMHYCNKIPNGQDFMVSHFSFSSSRRISRGVVTFVIGAKDYFICPLSLLNESGRMAMGIVSDKKEQRGVSITSGLPSWPYLHLTGTGNPFGVHLAELSTRRRPFKVTIGLHGFLSRSVA